MNDICLAARLDTTSSEFCERQAGFLVFKTQRAVELDDAAEKGDAAEQRELALLYAEGRGLRQDPDEARRWMGKAAAQGNEQAQAWLVKTGAEAACVFAVPPAPTPA